MISATQSASALSSARRMGAVAVIACVMVLELLDMTVLNVAIPTLRADFGASPAELQWMVAGYTTVFALCLITGGRLGDIFGYKRMLMLGMAGFTLASLLCGIAPGPTALVAARLLQGLAGALMVPQGTSLVQVMFAPHERMKPLALYGLLGGLASMLGPIIGGAIIGADWLGLGWRPIFLVNLPVGLITLILAAFALPEGRSPHAPTLDWKGTALSTLALFALLFPLIQGGHLGWPWWSFALFACAPMLLWQLWRHSRAREAAEQSPLIVPRLFGIQGFRVGLSVALLFNMGLTGFLFVLPIALQSGLGMSAAESGLTHMPMAFAVALGIGFLSRKILPRLGTSLMTYGGLIMAAAVLWMGSAVSGTHGAATPFSFLWPMLLAGFGMGLMIGPLPPCTLSDVDVGHAGAGSGLQKTVMQLGSALGVAMIGNLFFALGGDGERELLLSAYRETLWAVAGLLTVAALLALRFPRDLRLLKPQPAVTPAAP
jgi:EmrB/QacA subfamily drug resistance transporter